MISTDFHKIRRLPPYVFEQVNRTKAALPALSSVKVYETPMSWAEYEGEALR